MIVLQTMFKLLLFTFTVSEIRLMHNDVLPSYRNSRLYENLAHFVSEIRLMHCGGLTSFRNSDRDTHPTAMCARQSARSFKITLLDFNI